MIDIKLIFWFTAEESGRLITAAKTWWNRAETWIRWPLTQMDALTASIGIVDLLAYQRDIQRFPKEPEDLYRKRVKYALINAKDAASKTGFSAIFERLGSPLIKQIEREENKDWDVITLHLSDSEVTKNPDLGNFIIRQYGRTCRRYEFLNVDYIEPLSISINDVSIDRAVNYLPTNDPYIFNDVIEQNVIGLSATTIERCVDKIGAQK